MLAVQISQYGPASQMTINTIPTPSPKKNEVLIHNIASSVNPIDWKIRRGDLKLLSGLFSPPHLLGSDFAGEIVEVGPGVNQFKVGDRVYGFTNPLKGGGYAEYICAQQNNISILPNSISPHQAATIPLAATTALQALQKCHLQANQWVAINGCSGGVGVMAIQLAKAMGANIIGICSQKNHELAQSLGANITIDYTQQARLSSPTQCDLFFDVAGNRCHQDLSGILKKHGGYITTLPNIHTTLSCLTKKNHILAAPSQSALAQINRYIDNQQLKPIIEKHYPLDDIVAAHQHVETGRTVGKIAIDIQALKDTVTA